MRVSFVVPVKNDPRRLKGCLDTIARNQWAGGDVEVFVADNGSTDNSPAVAAAAGARVLSLPGLRVSELRNRAADSAAGDVLAFVDADHEIGPSWIASAVGILNSDGVAAAGALYSAPANGSWVQQTYGALRGHTVGQSDVRWLGSGNMAVRREAFEAVGGFDSSLEACEDVDFCQRLRAAGWRIVGDERLESVHLGDPPTLGALFRAERWRGRDNIRVSLRGGLSPEDIPSVLIPIVDLVAGLAAFVGLAVWPLMGPRFLELTLVALAIILGLAIVRGWRIVTRMKGPGLREAAQAFLVALTYDVARAAALVTRAGHHRPAQPAKSPASA